MLRDDKIESADTVVEEDITEDGESYLQNKEWLEQDKHIFILSESGKPIYTR